MKQSARPINTSRGLIAYEVILITVLRSGKIAGAAQTPIISSATARA
jgi:phosphoglycerate dehydrogenase-like enzyme